MSWHPKVTADAAQLWRKILLVTGGRPASVRQHCRARNANVCRMAGGDMPCVCRHWTNIQPSRRAIWVAVRSGMPIGLVSICSGYMPSDVARISDICNRLASAQPDLRTYVERITARVPMWAERAERAPTNHEGACDAIIA